MTLLEKILNSIFGTKKEPTLNTPKSGGSSVVFGEWSTWSTKLFIEVLRTTYTGKSTIGVMYVNDSEECYTLEDNDRLGKGNKKKKGITAIPEGTYNVKITHSPKFNRRLPLIQNVPGFRGIRIHPGNTAKDTQGCVMVGEVRGKDFIGRSRKAFNKLFKKIEDAQRQRKKITITIKGELKV